MFQSMGQHLYILLLVGEPTKTWHPLEGCAQTVIGSEKQTTCFKQVHEALGGDASWWARIYTYINRNRE